MPTEYLVCPETEIENGQRKVVACGDREVGVFRINDNLHAWHNICPHRQGPICQGRIYPRVVEHVDENGHTRTLAYDETRLQAVCPWHGYEYDLETGEAQGHSKLKLRRVELTVKEGDIYVIL